MGIAKSATGIADSIRWIERLICAFASFNRVYATEF